VTFVHTAHGPGRIVATETMRGRTRHKVAGAGFEAWLDSTQVHMAALGDINEDNSTTLPYDPEPQYPSDMWDHDSTIQPGEQEIDADERLSASDSLDFDSAPERPTPGPNPELFAKDAKVQPWTNDDWEQAENHDPTDRYRNHPDSWSHKPSEQDYADWEAKSGDGKKANLGPKFASWLLEAAPEGDDSVSRFKRDPFQEINRLGYLWTGGVEQPEMAQYGRLVEADKQLRTAAWADVRQKAQRLRREGRVHVLHKAPGNIYANVDGDHGTYSVLIAKVGFNSQSIDKWACSCEWGKWAFQRKISYVGRLCSHGYASYLEMQSDQHKNNPGRFHHPFDPGAMSPRKKRKTSAALSEFQDYVEDYRDGHVDIDAADNFISLPTHDQPLTEDDVDDIYDWTRNNHTERQPRDYKRHYTAAESSDGAKVLRTQPQGMTPDLIKVPGPGPSYFVDVEEDERETTGPGQTVLAMVDAQGNSYSPASMWRTAEETEDEVPVSSPGVATPRVPESAPTMMDEQTTPSAGLGSGFSMSDFTNIAGPIIDGVSQFAAPIAQGIGSAIGNIGSGLMRGAHRTAEYYMDGPTNPDTPTGEIDHLRELSDEEPDYGHRDTQNRGVRDAVDYLREEGFDASPIVARRQASYGLGNQDAAPPGGAYWQPGGGSWADGVFSGSGPDPKFWRSTSEDLIDRGDEDIDEVDVTEGEGETNHWDESDRPDQGKSARRRYAEDLHEEPDFFGEDGGRKSERPQHQYEPDMEREGRRFYADEEEVRNDLIQATGEEIEGIGLYNDFLDDAEDAGDESAAASFRETLGDEYEHVDQFSDALERQGGKHDLPGADLSTRDPDGHWSDLVNAHSNVAYPSELVEADPDYREERPMMKRVVGPPNKHRAPQHRAEAGMNDVVRRFQASGGGALAGSGGGGNYGDDDIAGQARKFLAKTAGRVYSLSEQQELVDESHPSGARNKPTPDDLAGTHYV